MGAVELEWIGSGSVTSPAGFVAGASYAGIKNYGAEPRLDLGLLASERPCASAGIFTQNRVCGAAVTLCKQRLPAGRAVVANSGCSNVARGEPGMADALRMTELAGAKLGVAPEQVFVASTGVIGRALPMPLIESHLPVIALSGEGGAQFARAIMTTDTVAKSRALRVRSQGRVYTLGGTAKGSGMVHPNMATVLCFLTSDAPAEPQWLQQTLARVGDDSLNMLDVDMDTSTSDTMLLLCNGAAGGEPLDARHPAARAFTTALRALAIELTRDLARDGEGARTLIEVIVTGAATKKDARAAARTVVSSPLVKTMVTGRDANLGRVLMALGRSGAKLELERVSVWIGDHCAFERGVATTLDYAEISRAMDRPELTLRADLGLGKATATAWGCDLTTEYVHINADYTS
ncbi:MAG: bifunctional glutamate N-acetyltransferase/amino-acid acetyltransferase ArgJ [Polyangiales bacterium]